MRNALQAGGFIAAYICCDVLSGPEARFQTIAPVWHPAAGLALYCVLQHGTPAALRPAARAAQIPGVQMLVLALTLSGFLIGIAVDVARRASRELRDSLRLAAAGEMAAAVAHELNQPPTALSAYGSACQRLLLRGGGDPLLQKR